MAVHAHTCGSFSRIVPSAISSAPCIRYKRSVALVTPECMEGVLPTLSRGIKYRDAFMNCRPSFMVSCADDDRERGEGGKRASRDFMPVTLKDLKKGDDDSDDEKDQKLYVGGASKHGGR